MAAIVFTLAGIQAVLSIAALSLSIAYTIHKWRRDKRDDDLL